MALLCSASSSLKRFSTSSEIYVFIFFKIFLSVLVKYYDLASLFEVYVCKLYAEILYLKSY